MSSSDTPDPRDPTQSERAESSQPREPTFDQKNAPGSSPPHPGPAGTNLPPPGAYGPQGQPGQYGPQGQPGQYGRQGQPGQHGPQGQPGQYGPQGQPGQYGPQGQPGQYGPQHLQAPPSPVKPKRPWFKKKRFIIPLAIVALFVLIGLVSPNNGDQPPSAVPAASSQEPVKSAASEASTNEPSEDPSDETTAEQSQQPTEQPAAKPKVYTGRGDKVVKFKKTVTDTMLVTTTWTGPQDNNTIYALDADGNEGDLLVNTIGSYKGTNIINLHEGDSVRALKVEGSGSWRIELKPASEARTWDGSGTFKGSSDNVINVSDVFDGLDSLKFKSSKADGNITVYGLGESEDLIVNEIGNFSGTYLVPSGTLLLRISSDGRWEMKKE